MSENCSVNRPLKITVVGDGTVGKTCLLIAYTTKRFDEEHVPTIFDNYSGDHTVDGITYTLSLWDTAGQEEYERLRPLSYPQTNCFIVCFALNNKVSFDNITHKWVPELRAHSQKTPIILVGTKKDIKTDDSVSCKKATRFCKKEGLAYYVECSAKTQEGIQEVFDKAVMAAVGITRRNRQWCVIL